MKSMQLCRDRRAQIENKFVFKKKDCGERGEEEEAAIPQANEKRSNTSAKVCSDDARRKRKQQHEEEENFEKVIMKLIHILCADPRL